MDKFADGKNMIRATTGGGLGWGELLTLGQNSSMKRKQRPWRGHGGRDVAGTTGSKAGRRDGKQGQLDLLLVRGELRRGAPALA